MIRQAYDRGSVGQYVEAIRGQLSSPALSEPVARAAAALPGEGDAATKVSAALTRAGQAQPRQQYAIQDNIQCRGADQRQSHSASLLLNKKTGAEKDMCGVDQQAAHEIRDESIGAQVFRRGQEY